ncbi:MAG: nickel-dependent hydrogenase large subunit [Thermodesulfobacteriota bacterium]
MTKNAVIINPNIKTGSNPNQNLITIDPITRIEGHLAIRVEVESGRVTKAFSAGEMFRGFEVLLKGRHPLDAQQITQRICGVCPVSHGMASVLAQDHAYGVSPPENGLLGRNLIQAANFIQSHIIHFYQLSALDFIDIAAVVDYRGNDPDLNELKAWVNTQRASNVLYPAAPFLPRYAGDYARSADLNITVLKHYLEALDMRALAHRMGAVFAGKLPHAPGLVPGGITETVTAEKIAAFESMLTKLRNFIDGCYLPDVLETARAFPAYLKQGKGCANFLAYGAFPDAASVDAPPLLPSGVLVNGTLADADPGRITEDTGHSFYAAASGLPPAAGQTIPVHDKQAAYSWVKAPRYDGTVMEVGPLARVMIAYYKTEDSPLKRLTEQTMRDLRIGADALVSVMGRHIARTLECKVIADQCTDWVARLVPGKPAFADFEVPEIGRGIGLTEAPRGALGHWLAIRNGKIDHYQCVVPTTWNCSPRDDQGVPGPVEQALVGIPVADADNPIEAVRVVRSFDPCLACAVH